MSPEQIITQLNDIKKLTGNNLQREALAWCVAHILHRQKELSRVPQEQKRAEKVSSTKGKLITPHEKDKLLAKSWQAAVRATKEGSSGD